MPDQFTQTTNTSYGSRIVNSFKGVIFGLILFVAAFGLLYWNEGRVDLSSIAKTATEISSASINTDSSLNGKLISTTGIIDTNQSIGDNLYLKPDKFIAVNRKVEMYSWKETVHNNSTNNTGGSSTNTKTYTYSEEWQETVPDSSNFQYPTGHINTQKSLDSFSNTVTAATIGVYNFDTNVELPVLSDLQLNAQNTTLKKGVVLANDIYLFMKKSDTGTFDGPQVGDLRISYQVLHPEFSGTIFGQLNNNQINSYSDQNGNTLYRLFVGTRDEAISTLHSEYTKWLWICRLIGFVMMWFGLSMLFGPITILLDILPIFGAISSALIGVIAFIVAFILSVVTILVSMILHSLIAVIIAVLITIGVIITVSIMLKHGKVNSASPTT
jgi:hypothetical protein